MKHERMMSWQQAVLYILTKRKIVKYIWHTCSWWQDTFSLWLILRKVTYEMMVSVPTENMIDIYNHTSPLIPQVASVCLTLHGQRCIHYENVFTSCKTQPQDIPRSPHPWCMVMASCMIDMRSILHDMDCPQASLVLRRQVRNSHHPTRGYLPSYLVVDVTLQFWK
jgi:hypothetical protein